MYHRFAIPVRCIICHYQHTFHWCLRTKEHICWRGRRGGCHQPAAHRDKPESGAERAKYWKDESRRQAGIDANTLPMQYRWSASHTDRHPLQGSQYAGPQNPAYKWETESSIGTFPGSRQRVYNAEHLHKHVYWLGLLHHVTNSYCFIVSYFFYKLAEAPPFSKLLTQLGQCCGIIIRISWIQNCSSIPRSTSFIHESFKTVVSSLRTGINQYFWQVDTQRTARPNSC